MRIPKIPPRDFTIRFSAIALAAIAPFICILSHGIEPSISSYWNTNLQPLFIITNFVTALYFIGMDNWRVSGILLLALTAFSVDLYQALHDITAIIFFLVNLWPLYHSHHYRWVIFIYLASLPVLFFGMLWAEIVAILSLCLHQGLKLRKLYILNKSFGNENMDNS